MSVSFAQKAQLLSVIYGPCFSEKADKAASLYRQFVFEVSKTANTRVIKQAIESIFEVEVADVRTLNVKGKVKRFKQRLGKQKSWKKAYVTLKPNYHIDFDRS